MVAAAQAQRRPLGWPIPDSAGGIGVGGNQHTQASPENPSLPLSDQAQLAVHSSGWSVWPDLHSVCHILHWAAILFQAEHHCRTQPVGHSRACMFLRALWGSWEGHATSKPSCRQVALLSPDPQLYQEIRERGLNTSHESDDDILDEPSSSEGTQRADTTIVVKSYRPAQLTWSQLPEVRSPTPVLNIQEDSGTAGGPHGLPSPNLWWPRPL